MSREFESFKCNKCQEILTSRTYKNHYRNNRECRLFDPDEDPLEELNAVPPALHHVTATMGIDSDSPPPNNDDASADDNSVFSFSGAAHAADAQMFPGPEHNSDCDDYEDDGADDNYSDPVGENELPYETDEEPQTPFPDASNDEKEKSDEEKSDEPDDESQEGPFELQQSDLYVGLKHRLEAGRDENRSPINPYVSKKRPATPEKHKIHKHVDEDYKEEHGLRKLVDFQDYQLPSSPTSSSVDSPPLPPSPCSKMYRNHKAHMRDYFVGGTSSSLKLSMPHSLEKSIKLLKLLGDHKTPLVLYEKIKSWHNDNKPNPPSTVPHDPFDSESESAHCSSLPSMAAAVREAAKLFNMTGLEPKTTRIFLEKSKIYVKVSTFDFEEMLRDLLTDPLLARDENWAFPMPSDPLHPPGWISPHKDGDPQPPPIFPDLDDTRAQSHILSELTACKWYFDTYMLKCVKGKDVLVPIILFMDKTHTSDNGNLKQEPVLFTLGIFNLATRCRPEAWRPLGYIPNLTSLTDHVDPVDKLEDYHQILSLVLSGLAHSQSKNGLKWRFNVNNKQHITTLRLEVAMVLGDNEGQDKLCGRYSMRTGKVKMLCRYCKCPTKEICTTLEDKYAPISQQEITNLVKLMDEQLKKKIPSRSRLSTLSQPLIRISCSWK